MTPNLTDRALAAAALCLRLPGSASDTELLEVLTTACGRRQQAEHLLITTGSADTEPAALNRLVCSARLLRAGRDGDTVVRSRLAIKFLAADARMPERLRLLRAPAEPQPHIRQLSLLG